MIQIATWNDYGEGTVIEPSWKNGYKHLEELQRRFGSEYSPVDLRLPERLLSPEAARLRCRGHFQCTFCWGM
jgi:hypothetical protein